MYEVSHHSTLASCCVRSLAGVPLAHSPARRSHLFEHTHAHSTSPTPTPSSAKLAYPGTPYPGKARERASPGGAPLTLSPAITHTTLLGA